MVQHSAFAGYFELLHLPIQPVLLTDLNDGKGSIQTHSLQKPADRLG